jgi:hypothetical protein
MEALRDVATVPEPAKRRALLLQTQGLPAYRHPIRQNLPEYLGRYSSCRARRTLAQLCFDPSYPSREAATFWSQPYLPTPGAFYVITVLAFYR